MEIADLAVNLDQENKFKVLEATRTSRSNYQTQMKQTVSHSQLSSIKLWLSLRIRELSKKGKNKNQLGLKRSRMCQISTCREEKL